jgi:hypothetical protein
MQSLQSAYLWCKLSLSLSATKAACSEISVLFPESFWPELSSISWCWQWSHGQDQLASTGFLEGISWLRSSFVLCEHAKLAVTVLTFLKSGFKCELAAINFGIIICHMHWRLLLQSPVKREIFVYQSRSPHCIFLERHLSCTTLSNNDIHHQLPGHQLVMCQGWNQICSALHPGTYYQWVEWDHLLG